MNNGPRRESGRPTAAVGVVTSLATAPTMPFPQIQGTGQFFESRRAWARLTFEETWPSRRLSRPARLIRELLDLDSAFRRSELSWPRRTEERGAFFVARAGGAELSVAGDVFLARSFGARRAGLVAEVLVEPATAVAFAARPPSFSQRAIAPASAFGACGGALSLSMDRESPIVRPSRPTPSRDPPERRVVPTFGPAPGITVNSGNPSRRRFRFFRAFMHSSFREDAVVPDGSASMILARSGEPKRVILQL